MQTAEGRERSRTRSSSAGDIRAARALHGRQKRTRDKGHAGAGGNKGDVVAQTAISWQKGGTEEAGAAMSFKTKVKETH